MASLIFNLNCNLAKSIKITLNPIPGVTFKVFRESDSSLLMLNNQDEIEVLPSPSREEFTVLTVNSTKGEYFLSDIKKVLCYIEED